MDETKYDAESMQQNDENKEPEENWFKKNKRKIIAGGVAVVGAIATAVFAYVAYSKGEGTDGIDDLLGSLDDTVSGLTSKTPSIETVELEQIPMTIKFDPIEEVVASPLEETANDIISRCPHDVSEHLRNLPKGYQASEEKMAEAADKGIQLLKGQTLVDAYRTGKDIAS